MTKRETAEAMVTAMRAEGAKFPVRYVSPLKDSEYGDGPMANSLGVNEGYGVCGCLNYWADGTAATILGSDHLRCQVMCWPSPWRKRYKRVKTVRAQYRVMADFVEAEMQGEED